MIEKPEVDYLQFEKSVVKSWKGWDNFGDDYHFYDCELNPDFFTEGQNQEFSKLSGEINVCISLGETSLIQISIGEHWFCYSFKFVQVSETERGEESE